MAGSARHASIAWIWLSVLAVVADQLSKYLAVQYLQFQVPHEVLPGFNLTLVHNTGAAFSFLRDAGGWQRWFFSILSGVVILVLFIWLLRLPARRNWLAAALALILGGAAGNLVDRVMLGYVIDFIDISISIIPLRLFNPWPAFNIADSCISVGAVMLIIDSFWFDTAEVSIHAGKPGSP